MAERDPHAVDDGDIHFVKRVCCTEHSTLQYCVWAEVSQPKKRAKPSKRIIAVTSYMLFVLKKVKAPTKKQPRQFPGTVKLKVVKEFHLLDLRSITKAFPDSPESHLYTSMLTKWQLELEFVKKAAVRVGTPRMPEVLRAIRSAVRMFTNGFPNNRLPALFGVKESEEEYGTDQQLRLLPLDVAADYGPGHGFLHTYSAYCYYYKEPVSNEIMRYVTDLAEAGITEFSLSDCPFLDATGVHASTLPVTTALRFNTYFRALSAHHISRKEVMMQCSSLFRYNTTMSRLSLSHLTGGGSDVTELGNALEYNSQHSLQIMEICNMPVKCSSVLFSSLSHYTHALQVLNLSGAGLDGKHLTNLANALVGNFGMSLTIEELDLSNNKFDDQASIAFETWLSKAAEHSPLQVLRLANTNQTFSTAAAYFHFFAQLRELDVSRNKLETRAVQLLCSMAQKSSTLKIINCSACNLSGKSAAAIASAIVQNKKLSATHFDLSANDMAEPDAEFLAQALTRNFNCHTLILSKNKWKEKGLIGLLQSIVLSASTTLDTLVLDNTFKSTYAGERTASALMSVSNSLESVRSISIAGGFGSVAVPFMEYLKTNETVVELDVSGNGMGDVGASSIAELLRHNTTLRKLKCDGNGISLTGWKMILSSFLRNRTLLFMDFPWQDYGKCSGLSPDRLAELRDVLLDLQRALQTNHNLCEDPLDRFTPSLGRPAPDLIYPLSDVPKQLSFREDDTSLSSLAAEKINAPGKAEETESTSPSPSPPNARRGAGLALSQESYQPDVDEGSYDDSEESEGMPEYDQSNSSVDSVSAALAAPFPDAPLPAPPAANVFEPEPEPEVDQPLSVEEVSEPEGDVQGESEGVVEDVAEVAPEAAGDGTVAEESCDSMTDEIIYSSDENFDI